MAGPAAEAYRAALRPRSNASGTDGAVEFDFVHDTLADGQPFLTLIVVDN